MDIRPQKPNGLSVPSNPLEKETFYCSYPNCAFQDKRKIRVACHEKCHSPSSIHWLVPCQVCAKFFPSLVTFLQHMSSGHLDNLSCPSCPFLGSELTEFKAHVLAHNYTLKSSSQSSSDRTIEVPLPISSSTSFTLTEDRSGHDTPNPLTPSAQKVQARIPNKIPSLSGNSKQAGESSHDQGEESSCPSDPNPGNVRSFKVHPTVSISSREKSGRVRRQVRCSCCSSSSTPKENPSRQPKKKCLSRSIPAPKSQQRIQKSIENSKQMNNSWKPISTRSSSGNAFRCGYCPLTFKHKASLVRHQQRSCDYSLFNGKVSLILQTETEEESSQESFENSQLFKEKVRERLNQEKVIPSLIQTDHEIKHGIQVVKEENQEGESQNGREKVIRIQRTRFACHSCSFTTLHPFAMRRHYRVHTGERPFKCPNLGCDYRARWVENLRSHLQKSCRGRTIESTTTNVETEDDLGLDLECRKEDQVTGENNSNLAFACMLCNFIGDSQWSALMHSCQHKNLVVLLDRI